MKDDEIVTTGLSLPRSIMARVTADAESQKRSRSSQIALIIEDYYRRLQDQAAATSPQDTANDR